MYKKELISISKRTLVILSFLFIVPVLYLLDILLFKTGLNYIHVLAFIFALLVFWISQVYSYTFYKQEEEDNAWEYLLTLPVSRVRIFWYKMLPRLIILIVLLAIHAVLYYFFLHKVPMEEFPVFHPLSYALLLVFMLFLSGFTGWGWSNSNVSGVIVYWFLFFLSIGSFRRLLDKQQIESFLGIGKLFLPIVITFFILTLVCATIFFKVFKEFDCKPISIHAEKFSKFVMPILVPMLVICIFILFSVW